MQSFFKSAFVTVCVFVPVFSSQQFAASFSGQVFGAGLIIAILCIFVLPRVSKYSNMEDFMAARESFQGKLKSLREKRDRRGITPQTLGMLDNISKRFEYFRLLVRGDDNVSWGQVRKDLNALRDELEALAVLMNQEASEDAATI